MKTTNPPSMLLRVSLAAAIVAGLAVTGLNLSRVKQKLVTLQTNLAAQTQARQQAETELAGTQTRLTAATNVLHATKAELEKTAAEKQEALATAAAQTKRAEKISADLVQSTQQRETAQAEVARYRAAGMEPEQVMMAVKQIKDLSTALAAAQQTNRALVTLLQPQPAKEDGPVLLPSGLRAKVLVCDPKWHFIVLNAGQNQGVLKDGEMLLSRQGKLVARAKVTQVQGDRCVAALMPGWELTEVMEGDAAIPAFPRS
jgi:hypothetical protein